MALSQTEENYLKELYHLSEGKQNVSTNALAASMNTTPASANDMLKRLAQKGMLNHVKYKGATITNKGSKAAVGIIRKHRLWEVFLVDKLKFEWDEVHEIAEQLEHIRSPILTERLDEFLGYPTLDPHGDPIPDKDGNFQEDQQIPLLEMEANQVGILTNVTSDNSALLQHLGQIGLRLGSTLLVNSISSFDGSILGMIEGKEVFISREVANHLMITLK